MIYTELVTIVMGISLVLYVLLGGADFGAGIIELFTGDRANRVISRAIAPVWEANHIWLIIAVVILFNGFPKVYAEVSTALHIPILITLMGIIARGSAFTFRHYDAVVDQWHKWYSIIFRWSSLLTVFFLGVTLGAVISGTIPVEPTNFVDYYFKPWLNLFTLSMGLFLTVLSAYISAIFLLGEVETQEGYMLIWTFIKRLFIGAVVSGLLLLLSSYIMDVGLHSAMIKSPISIISMVLATIAVPLVFRAMKDKNIWRLRFIVGAQVLLIILGWLVVQWPHLLSYSDGSSLTIYNASAPKSTMKILFTALAVGVMIIFPSLFYLFKVYKRPE